MSITIKPVRFTENGFMTEQFALGGEGAEGLDPNVKYRSCLQNWVIDTGSEVILVDTGLPAEFPDAAPTADAAISQTASPSSPRWTSSLPTSPWV